MSVIKICGVVAFVIAGVAYFASQQYAQDSAASLQHAQELSRQSHAMPKLERISVGPGGDRVRVGSMSSPASVVKELESLTRDLESADAGFTADLLRTLAWLALGCGVMCFAPGAMRTRRAAVESANATEVPS